MIEERVEVREGDILIIHTGYHHFGWDQPYGNEVRYMVMHPGPDARFAEWCIAKKIKWIGVDWWQRRSPNEYEDSRLDAGTGQTL